jgi:hypothetical protein
LLGYFDRNACQDIFVDWFTPLDYAHFALGFTGDSHAKLSALRIVSPLADSLAVVASPPTAAIIRVESWCVRHQVPS